MRLLRNRKLKEAKDAEAAEKLRCLEAEMVAEGEDISRISLLPNDPVAIEEGLSAFGVGSPFSWFDPSLVVVSGTAGGGLGNSSSS